MKIAISLLVTTVLCAGFLLSAATNLPILEQSARNLYFHVPMWFVMMSMSGLSAWHAFKYLKTQDLSHDIKSEAAMQLVVLFGVIGLVTGMMWARFTWYIGTGKFWNWDPKQTFALFQVLVCGAYFVLREAVQQERSKARLAAAYNLFAFAILPFTLFVLPRRMQSLHPGGQDGMPAFDKITDPTMRYIFYPAIIAFIAIAWWLWTQRVRTKKIEMHLAHQ